MFMKKYIVKLSNTSVLQQDLEHIVKSSENYCGHNLAFYQTFNFIDGTGYMKTVREEIEFVLGSYRDTRIHKNEIIAFAEKWGLEKYLNFDLSSLSEGWKKFLGLALFTNNEDEGKIYFDSCRQLSNKLISTLEKNINQSNCKTIFFFEYDSNLLLQKDYSIIYFYGGQFLDFPPQLDNSKLFDEYETNYELS